MSDYLTPKAREHWDFLRRDREKYGFGVCLCPLCELIPSIEENVRKAKAEAWDEGYSDCWTYHVSEGTAGRQDNPYTEES